MCCALLLASGLGPRLALALVWIFGNRVELAFDTWVWPLLGLIFLPWTTLFYVLMWSAAGGVSGAEWILVGLGFVFDLMTYSARSAYGRYGGQRAY
jgi:hypothetical protein